MIKTLLYTGVRVSELVVIRVDDVDFTRCQIRVNKGKGAKGTQRTRRSQLHRFPARLHSQNPDPRGAEEISSAPFGCSRGVFCVKTAGPRLAVGDTILTGGP